MVQTWGPGADRGELIAETEQLLGGRYVFDEMLGRGYLATVYRAIDTTLDRAVAVKLLHQHIGRDPRFVAQFLELERRIARLFHPHLVTVFDAGLEGDRCFVVMEYVPGGSLRDRLVRGQEIPPTESVRIVSQIAAALQVLHDEGVVHGDVKPENVLLDDDGSAKLSDFGIAHLATTTGVISMDSLQGGAPYLAPEQLEHGQTDARSDQYVLGLVAYELLAGRQPFEGDNWVTVASQRLHREPDPLAEIRPDLPPELSPVVRRALARDPQTRFGSVEAFGEALRRALTAPPRAAVPRPDPTPAAPSVAAAGSFRLKPADRPAESSAPSERTRVVRRETVRPRPTAHRSLSWPNRLGRPNPIILALLAATLIGGLLLLGAVGLLSLARPGPIPAPPLAGQPLEAAQQTARAAGLDLTVSREPSETVPPGVILRQDPAPDSAIPGGRPLAVVVSSGLPPVQVPDLRRRRLDDARRDLAALGLGLGKVGEREVADHPPGTIVQQSTPAGGELARGAALDVTVGLAPRTAAPKLIDRSIGEAEAELEQRGLRLGGVQLQPAAGKPAGTVLAQDPAPDVQLRRGESVAITVSVPPPAPALSSKP